MFKFSLSETIEKIIQKSLKALIQLCRVPVFITGHLGTCMEKGSFDMIRTEFFKLISVLMFCFKLLQKILQKFKAIFPVGNNGNIEKCINLTRSSLLLVWFTYLLEAGAAARALGQKRCA